MSVENPKSIRWLKIALGELDAAVRRIEQDSVAAADRFRKRVFERTALLGSHPKSGGMHPDYPKARFLVEDSYLILYTVHRAEVVIRAVVHGARLFRKKWVRRTE